MNAFAAAFSFAVCAVQATIAIEHQGTGRAYFSFFGAVISLTLGIMNLRVYWKQR